jgi:L-rhamnose mutarotase
MQRFASVIRIPQSQQEAFERHHANVWPEVLEILYECNIRNFSMYRYGELLFEYLEYVGTDFESDMKKVSQNPKNIEWRNLIAPLLERVEEATSSEHWHIIPEVFHLD